MAHLAVGAARHWYAHVIDEVDPRVLTDVEDGGHRVGSRVELEGRIDLVLGSGVGSQGEGQ